MKRQFCKWKDVGAVVPIRTSSRIWSSLKVAAGSKYLVALRLRMQSMTSLVMVIPSVMVTPMGEGDRLIYESAFATHGELLCCPRAARWLGATASFNVEAAACSAAQWTSGSGGVGRLEGHFAITIIESQRFEDAMRQSRSVPLGLAAPPFGAGRRG